MKIKLTLLIALCGLFVEFARAGTLPTTAPFCPRITA
jgi:hypothetical protein